jgi:hypothetical protein
LLKEIRSGKQINTQLSFYTNNKSNNNKEKEESVIIKENKINTFDFDLILFKKSCDCLLLQSKSSSSSSSFVISDKKKKLIKSNKINLNLVKVDKDLLNMYC